MPVEQGRFLELVVGKACALAVLSLSLTNQMSSVVGVGYFNPDSFLICLLFAVAFAFAIPLFKRKGALLALSSAVATCSMAWRAARLSPVGRGVGGGARGCCGSSHPPT